MSKQIEALLTERAGYENRGLKDRVALVDAQLQLLGFSHKYISPTKEPVIVETASFEPEIETAVVKRGRKPKDLNGDN
jgi:hypothetical protein